MGSEISLALIGRHTLVVVYIFNGSYLIGRPTLTEWFRKKVHLHKYGSSRMHNMIEHMAPFITTKLYLNITNAQNAIVIALSTQVWHAIRP